jgi:hypothetical protein
MNVELYHWPLRKQPVFAAVAGLIFVPLAIVAAYRLTPPLARLDDAYIALHSARVVLSGHDPIFGVPALVGATSPAYVALLTGILAAGVTDGDTALRLANALGIVAFAWSVWYLAGVEKLSLVRRVALVIIALGSGVIIPFNLTNGLETGWAIATLTFALAAARAGRTVAVALAAGLLPFLRPDLAPASLVVLIYAIRGRQRSEQLGAIAVAVAMALPRMLWTRLDTGAWVTQTVRAKQLFFAEGCRPWTEKTLTVLRATAVGLAQMFPLSLGIIALCRDPSARSGSSRTTSSGDKLGRVGLLALASSVVAYYVGFPGALEQPFFRYLTALSVPWLCLGLALNLPRVPSPVAGGVAVAVIVAQMMFGHDQNTGFSRDIKATAEWIDASLPKTAVLLVHDAGGISEFAHHRAVDLVGLKTPSSVAAHARWTWPSCVAQRGAAVTDIARRSGANYFIAVTGWDEFLRPDLIEGGFDLTPMRQPPAGKGGYTVYRMDSGDQPRDR